MEAEGRVEAKEAVVICVPVAPALRTLSTRTLRPVQTPAWLLLGLAMGSGTARRALCGSTQRTSRASDWIGYTVAIESL